jgi:hypothetical protein
MQLFGGFMLSADLKAQVAPVFHFQQTNERLSSQPEQRNDQPEAGANLGFGQQ